MHEAAIHNDKYLKEQIFHCICVKPLGFDRHNEERS